MKEIDFDNMTVSDLEELVGKKAIDVQQERKWIAVTFANGVTGRGGLASDITVRFARW